MYASTIRWSKESAATEREERKKRMNCKKRRIQCLKLIKAILLNEERERKISRQSNL
jgi:hypothetical protein